MRRLSLSTTLLLVATSAGAAPPPPRPISTIVEEADLIAVGSLHNIRAEGDEEESSFQADLKVDKLIFGGIPADGIVKVNWWKGPQMCAGYHELENHEGQNAVWLLKKEQDRYSFIHWDSIWFFDGRVLWYPSVESALRELRGRPGVSPTDKSRLVLDEVEKRRGRK